VQSNAAAYNKNPAFSFFVKLSKNAHHLFKGKPTCTCNWSPGETRLRRLLLAAHSAADQREQRRF